MTKFSVLDLCPVFDGKTPRDAFQNALDLAQLAEQLGYHRYWLAEHHNMAGIASAATSVVIGHVAGGTSRIRVGAGGVMLPNHSPLVIAEQFGTLASLFPGRIDLGLGRAPGTDQLTAQALRRTLSGDVNQFPRDVVELLGYFQESQPGQKIRAVPGEGLRVPVWILGSSLFGAQLAAALGLPYAFASHFAPADLMAAIDLYRNQFKPSVWLDKPYLMLGFTVVAADSDGEAVYMASSMQQAYVNLHSGRPGKLPPPKENYLAGLAPHERAVVDHMSACSATGSPTTVGRKIDAFIARTRPDEVMFTGNMFDHQARLHSFAIVADIMKRRNRTLRG
jgi:luciferase family oxidoreductase group 1